MLSTKNLTFAYPDSKAISFPDLRVNKNEPLLILGQSGSGKTTLLHLLARFLAPKTGQIIINDRNIESLDAKELQQFRAENIGMIFQQNHFVKSLNGLENLLVANFFAQKKQNKERALTLANSLGLKDKIYKPVTALSGGELQRLSIARSLMNSPQLILADEPTANLDDKNCHLVYDLLATNAANINAMLVIVTHDHRLKNLVPNTVQL